MVGTGGIAAASVGNAVDPDEARSDECLVLTGNNPGRDRGVEGGVVAAVTMSGN